MFLVEIEVYLDLMTAPLRNSLRLRCCGIIEESWQQERFELRQSLFGKSQQRVSRKPKIIRKHLETDLWQSKNLIASTLMNECSTLTQTAQQMKTHFENEKTHCVLCFFSSLAFPRE